MNTQKTEDYVSFETAKLLKEKGYKGSFNGYYNNAGCVVDKPNFFLKAPEYQYYERVSLQMAMKWLREVHNLVIQIELIDFLEHGEVWLYCITERKTIKQLTGRDEDFTEHSYEEACEAAIKYCLENLI